MEMVIKVNNRKAQRRKCRSFKSIPNMSMARNTHAKGLGAESKTSEEYALSLALISHIRGIHCKPWLSHLAYHQSPSRRPNSVPDGACHPAYGQKTTLPDLGDPAEGSAKLRVPGPGRCYWARVRRGQSGRAILPRSPNPRSFAAPSSLSPILHGRATNFFNGPLRLVSTCTQSIIKFSICIQGGL